MRGRVGRLGAWVGMLDRRRKFGGTGEHSPKKHSCPTAARLYASCVAARATTALSAERSGQRQTFRSVGLCLGCAGSLPKRLASAPEPQRVAARSPEQWDFPVRSGLRCEIAL
jgi:hypothetical protein